MSTRESPFLEALDEVSDAVESGAGLPAVARAAGRALDASVIVLDAASSVLAVACASPEDERAVLAGEGRTAAVELRVADVEVGRLRYRPRGEPPPGALLRLVANLIGLELERSRAPERASEEAVADFIRDALTRRVTDRENIVARAGELGCDLSGGLTALVVRARPYGPEEGDWRAALDRLAQASLQPNSGSCGLLVRLNLGNEAIPKRQLRSARASEHCPTPIPSPLGSWREVSIPMQLGNTAPKNLERLPRWLSTWKREYPRILIDLGPLDQPVCRAVGRYCDSCLLLLGPETCASPTWLRRYTPRLTQCDVTLSGSIVVSTQPAAVAS